jgi:NADPH:quinone reductase-like Zn-dependent oxidoreductase
MKAIVYDKYGPPEVLHLAEVPDPIPKDGEVLVRVRAASVSSGDARVRAMKIPTGFGLFARLGLGVFEPRKPILGTELAGVVDAVGWSWTTPARPPSPG